IDWLEALGISYKTMEEQGVMLPVYEMSTRFIRPAGFDDLLKVETRLRELPGVKIIFDYSIFNIDEELITTASTSLVFMDSRTRKVIRCPQNILNKLQE
ncbi:MAG: thioesterase family protein, partial [Gillisia sp.]